MFTTVHISEYQRQCFAKSHTLEVFPDFQGDLHGAPANMQSTALMLTVFPVFGFTGDRGPLMTPMARSAWRSAFRMKRTLTMEVNFRRRMRASAKFPAAACNSALKPLQGFWWGTIGLEVEQGYGT